MKSKIKKTDILLALVALGLWGYVYYSFFYKKKLNEDTLYSENSYQQSPSRKELDTFSLLANYVDPFLEGRMERTEMRSANPTLVTQTPASNTKTIATWPSIQYMGKIRASAKEEYTAFLKVNGKDFLMEKGEENEQIKLLRVFSDSIYVSMGKEKKTIYKK